MTPANRCTPLRPPRAWRACLVLAGALAAPASRADVFAARAPMTCSRGPSAQTFAAVVTMPRARPTGSTFTVRIDSMPSGTISHFGLNAIFNMTTDFGLSPGLRYVEGSVRLVPGTGTPNALPGARAWHDAAGIHLALPARVGNGTSYTPPSFEFELAIDAPAGAAVAVQFVHYQVDADVFMLGGIRTTCDPTPRPATIATLQVVAPGAP